MFKYINANGEVLVGKIIKQVVALLVIIVMAFGSFGTVGAGQRGIKLRFGAVTGKIYNSGLYFKTPFIEKVVPMDVQTQVESASASAASKDLQTVNASVALNYSVDPNAVAKIYQEIGIDYKVRIIDPIIQESVKASTAKYTAEELITKREEVRDDIKAHLVEKLTPTGILVEQFSITNFNFSVSFNKAIEDKVTAEQNALAAKNKLSQVQFEAQQAVEEATGKAKALQIEGAALAQNPAVKELRAIEKWNGVLPQVTGGAVPFVNIK